MPIDLLAKFSVTEKVLNEEGKELFDMSLSPGEHILLYYQHYRDKIIFTDTRLIAIDIQGLTGKKNNSEFFHIQRSPPITSRPRVPWTGTVTLRSGFRGLEHFR